MEGGGWVVNSGGKGGDSVDELSKAENGLLENESVNQFQL